MLLLYYKFVSNTMLPRIIVMSEILLILVLQKTNKILI